MVQRLPFARLFRLIRTSVRSVPSLLSFTDPFQVLIATVLSQRTRDEVTAEVSQNLFAHYPTASALARASLKDVERLIRRVGFFREKSRRILEIAKIVSLHGMPKTFSDLIRLPGVGRKTANCVLAFAYNTPAIAVDTHVHRIANRLGLVKTKTPHETERALMRTIPRRYWRFINETFVRFGRTICKPISPLCHACPVLSYCPFGSNRTASSPASHHHRVKVLKKSGGEGGTS